MDFPSEGCGGDVMPEEEYAKDGARYARFVEQGVPEQELTLMREALPRGQLTGNQRFVDEVGQIIGCRNEHRRPARRHVGHERLDLSKVSNEQAKYMRYSIIVPHFNDAVRLKRLLRTIPEREDLEVLVVDDCSPQSPEELLPKQAHSGLKILRTDSNRGAGAARNKGLARATGDWILFADSDDIFEPGAFDAFDKFLDDNVDIVFFQTRSVNEETQSESARSSGVLEATRTAFQTESSKVIEDLKRRHVVPWGKVFRRRFIVENGFVFEEVRYSNDVMFALRCNMAASKIRIIGDVGYSVTRRPGSLTETRTRNSFLARYDVFLRAHQFLRTHGAGSRDSSLLSICASALRFGPGTVLEVWRRGREAHVPLLAAKFARPAWWLQKAKLTALGVKERL